MVCKQRFDKVVRHRRGLPSGIAIGILLASAAVANAQPTTTYWKVATGDWGTASNWSSGVPVLDGNPTGDYAYIYGLSGVASAATLSGSGVVNIFMLVEAGPAHIRAMPHSISKVL